MKAKDFLGKFCSKFLIGNLLAMLLVVIALMFSVKYGLDWYTHHGEGIKVPKVEGILYSEAYNKITAEGLNIIISDSGYNKRLPADCILSQNPGPGTMVKAGHDVVDNSSYREAEAKLMALGFKLLPPKLVDGEKDWVYGILCQGRRVATGDHVSIDSPLTLMIGSGQYDAGENIDYIEPEYQMMQSGEVDDFEELVE